MTEHDTYRLAKRAMRRTCMCDHARHSHTLDPGFYDVATGYGACNVRGCPCERYDERVVR